MESYEGMILLADPSVEYSFFERSVILLVNHDAEGAMGLVLNRRAGISLISAWEASTDAPCVHDQVPLHVGGPVGGPLMLLHDCEELADRSVADGIWFSAEQTMVEACLADETLSNLGAFAGYAGWEEGQLEREIEEGAWLLWQPPEDWLWTTDMDDMYISALRCTDPGAASILREFKGLPQDLDVF